LIALDSNVILRLIIGDDTAQQAAAARVFARAMRDASAVYLSDPVLCEVAWTLRSRYGRSRNEIADTIDALLQTEGVVIDNRDAVVRAVSDFRDGRGDFPDYLIRERSLDAGASEVVTFDRALKAESGFRVIGV
jgi:predicted nucleic-acid-binding protein